MDRNGFGKDATGILISTIGGRKAFLPDPLPPAQIDLNSIAGQLSAASQAIGELRGVGRSMANPRSVEHTSELQSH